MSFTFAHISDLHLGNMPKVSFLQLMGKRLTGYLSWHLNRKGHHRLEVLDALKEDLQKQQPDHICITGDIVNISLPNEFRQAQAWLEDLGASDQLSVIPGNHDAYVANTLNLWQDTDFPFVHKKDGVAFIGVSSAVPMPPFIAAGKIGDEQLAKLAQILKETESEGLTRVILIHHPVQHHRKIWRKSLWDTDALKKVIKENGAELVLHGHIHKPLFEEIEGKNGKKVPVYGAGSASLYDPKKGHMAHYQLFNVDKGQISVSHHVYEPSSHSFIQTDIHY